MSDVAEKFAAFIESELPVEGDWVAAVEADRILKVIEPSLLNQWLKSQAHPLLVNYITARRASEKAKLARTISRGAFAEAAERFQAGEDDALDPFAVRYVIDAENTSRPLGDMTGDDLTFAADTYRDAAKPLLMQEAFLRALAKKVRAGKTVRECVTVEQLSSLSVRVAA